LQRGLFTRFHLAVRHHDEVDVAVLVCVPDRERALQVGADEIRTEDPARAVDERPQDIVQFRIRVGATTRARS
jgi:hypothetical protein